MQYVKRDITTVTSGVVVQGVNCQGKMRAGLALRIRQKWPDVYSQYMHAYKLIRVKRLLLGTVQVTEVEPGLFVFNCFTQEFYGRDKTVKYASVEAIEKCLTMVFKCAKLLGATEMYLPKIGCGLGGLDWEKDVEPIVAALENRRRNKINIFICDVK